METLLRCESVKQDTLLGSRLLVVGHVEPAPEKRSGQGDARIGQRAQYRRGFKSAAVSRAIFGRFDGLEDFFRSEGVYLAAPDDEDISLSTVTELELVSTGQSCIQCVAGVAADSPTSD